MNSIFEHILVIESQRDDQGLALKRAVDVANQNNAVITVFKSFYKEVHDKHFNSGLPDDLSMFVVQQEQLICEQFNQLTDKDLSLNIIISWQNPAVTSISKMLQEHDISLVIKSFDKEKHLRDFFTLTVERYLTHNCELPFWLVKNASESFDYKILACLDIDDDADTNKALNHTILEATEQFMPIKSAELHILDCYYGESASIAINYDVDTGFKKELSVKRIHMNNINNYVNAHPSVHGVVHINEAMPDDDIPRTANEIHAGLTIIGNCKHDNFFNRALGDTTQLLTDNIPSDILVIKSDYQDRKLA